MFPSFSSDALPSSFDADAVRQAAFAHGTSVLELQRQLAAVQLEQLAASQAHLTALASAQNKAFTDGLAMMFDAQKSALDLWKPTAE